MKSLIKQCTGEIQLLFAGAANKESGGAAANSSQGLGCCSDTIGCQCVSAESQQEAAISWDCLGESKTRFDFQWDDSTFSNGHFGNFGNWVGSHTNNNNVGLWIIHVDPEII